MAKTKIEEVKEIENLKEGIITIIDLMSEVSFTLNRKQILKFSYNKEKDVAYIDFVATKQVMILNKLFTPGEVIPNFVVDEYVKIKIM